MVTSLLTNVVTIAVAGLGLAFGLGGRDVAHNALAGYYAREVYRLGNTLVIDGEEGILEAIGTLNAEIAVGNGRVIIPNTQLTGSRTKILDESTGEE